MPGNCLIIIQAEPHHNIFDCRAGRFMGLQEENFTIWWIPTCSFSRYAIFTSCCIWTQLRIIEFSFLKMCETIIMMKKMISDKNGFSLLFRF